MIGAMFGNTDTIVELIKEGADIHMQDKVCCLFLHLTLCMRHHYLVSIRCIDWLSACHHTGWKHCTDLRFGRTWNCDCGSSATKGRSYCEPAE